MHVRMNIPSVAYKKLAMQTIATAMLAHPEPWLKEMPLYPMLCAARKRGYHIFSDRITGGTIRRILYQLCLWGASVLSSPRE
jgi:hypothetical protein